MTEVSAPAGLLPVGPLAPRKTSGAMLRGARLRCPSCGEGSLYSSYLKVADTCSSCGEALHHQRADDAPATLDLCRRLELEDEMVHARDGAGRGRLGP